MKRRRKGEGCTRDAAARENEARRGVERVSRRESVNKGEKEQERGRERRRNELGT